MFITLDAETKTGNLNIKDLSCDEDDNEVFYKSNSEERTKNTNGVVNHASNNNNKEETKGINNEKDFCNELIAEGGRLETIHSKESEYDCVVLSFQSKDNERKGEVVVSTVLLYLFNKYTSYQKVMIIWDPSKKRTRR